MLYLAVLCDRGEHDDGYSDSDRLELLSSGLARGLRVLYHEYGNAELDRLTALGRTINHDPSFKIDRATDDSRPDILSPLNMIANLC